ncbi:MAG TPA: MFS transporter [Candidatus Dormibacteraeota bacterium]
MTRIRVTPYAGLVLGNLAGRAVDGIFLVTLNWSVYVGTGSVALLAVTVLIQALPFLVLTLPAGVVADRWHRGHLVVITAVLRGIAGSLLAIALLAHRPALALVVAFVWSTARVFSQPARQALIPSLVVPADLLKANALIAAVGQSIWLIAALPGGWLLAHTGAGVTTGIITAGYLLAALLMVPCWDERGGASNSAGERGGLGARIAHLRRAGGVILRDQSMSAMLVVYGVATMLGRGFLNVGLPVLAVSEHADSSFVGLLYGASGLGMGIGGLLLTRLRSQRYAVQVMVGWLGNGIGLMAVLLAPGSAGAALALFAVGLAWAIVDAPASSLLHSRVPAALLGASFSLWFLVVWVGESAASLFGVVFTLISPPVAFGAAGAGLVAVAVIGLLWVARPVVLHAQPGSSRGGGS